jgi:hypothetical protein
MKTVIFSSALVTIHIPNRQQLPNIPTTDMWAVPPGARSYDFIADVK